MSKERTVKEKLQGKKRKIEEGRNRKREGRDE